MSKKPRLGKDPLSFIQDSRQADTNTEETPNKNTQTSANNIKGLATKKGGHQRFEDKKRRQTYWMDPEEIKMVAEMSKKAGVGKYQVVSAAVRLLYEYVFSKEDEDK